MSDNICENCGKMFTIKARLDAHKNRKKPCGFNSFKYKDIFSLKHCIFCNVVFNKKQKLDHHMTSYLIKLKIQADQNFKIIYINKMHEHIVVANNY